ncbi:hypothetical protein [Intestinimonas timonensis]|uniref:hypothetical protein n=1 Tax=Intestinimonas timonensis TaxID=1689270 RepID=UPI0024B07B0C|nr:hypothetical protein [Intestinimonas timonensis]
MDVQPEIIVALLSLIGTLAGSLLGVLASNKLTNYRIEQLEKKVAAHNQLVERTYKLEGEMQEVQHDIRDLKKV